MLYREGGAAKAAPPFSFLPARNLHGRRLDVCSSSKQQIPVGGGVGMNTDLVRYVCRAQVHVAASRTARLAAVNPVTIHDGVWAYCPAGSRTDHEWEAIEPVTLTDLKLVEVIRPRETATEESRS